MYSFDDKKVRPICLIPEVTGPIQELWRDRWARARTPKRIFYIARCYRYERPQFGRYREFTQLGVELLGAQQPEDKEQALRTLTAFLDATRVPYALDERVSRGLGYYTEDGFEARCELLGAQKQLAGGGRYAEGVGWAIGLDRLLLAKELSEA